MRVTAAAVVLFILAACGHDSPAPSRADREPSGPSDAAADGSGRSDLLADSDARRWSGAYETGLLNGSAEVRRLAARSLARLHDERAVGALLLGLRDLDPEVRRTASLGLAGFEGALPAEAGIALLGALAAEDLEVNRAAMIADLGRVSPPSGPAAAALLDALANGSEPSRAAACFGFGSMALRGQVLGPGTARRISARMADDHSKAVRLACAFALSRATVPAVSAEADAVLQDLMRAVRDRDPELRAMAVRALGPYRVPGDALLVMTNDADWQVSVQAFRALGRQSRSTIETTMAQALAETVAEAPSDLSGGPAHVLLAAFEAAGPHARLDAIYRVAVDALKAIERQRPRSPDRGRAHCAAAKLADLGRGWPSQVEECGLGQVDETSRQVLAAEVVGAAVGSEADRAAFLRRLFRATEARVRQAVVSAAGSVSHPDAERLVLEGLRDSDPGVVATGSDAMVHVAERWRAATPGVASVRPAGEPAPPPGSAWSATRREVRTALERARATLGLGEHELEGLQGWARTAESLGLVELKESVCGLTAHSNPSVRSAAASPCRALGGEPSPSWAEISQRNLGGAALLADLDATIVTSRGSIRIRLLASEAPHTVGRFAELARAGFYAGLTFHRVVPAFVVQGGDPRGDGYGGPNWSQRCEDNRIPYARGTLGMALAGRDTGGSQFFITHGPQPHLNGRYTAFGRVTSGMDIVDRLQQGDRITAITISN